MPGDDREINRTARGYLRGRTFTSAPSQAAKELKPGWVSQSLKHFGIEMIIQLGATTGSLFWGLRY